MRQFLSSVCFCRFVNFGTLGTKYGNGIVSKKKIVSSLFIFSYPIWTWDELFKFTENL